MKDKKTLSRTMFQQYSGFVISLFLVIVYIGISFISIEFTKTNILNILANSALIFLFAWIINSSLLKQGISQGLVDERYISTVQSHNVAIDDIQPNVTRLQPWLDEQYRKILKEKRSFILQLVNIKYEDVFDELGFAKEYKIEKEKLKDKKHLISKLIAKNELWRHYRFKKKCIGKAKRVKLTHPTNRSLLDRDSVYKDEFDYGENTHDYLKKKSTMSLFTKIFTTTGFALIQTALSGFTLNSFIYVVIEISVVFGMGLLGMAGAFFFVVNTFRSNILSKISKLKEFKAYCGIAATQKTAIELTKQADVIKQNEEIKEIAIITES